MKKRLFALFAATAALTACGGGGGNPGTCYGGLACNRQSAPGQGSSADFVRVIDARLRSITCAEIGALNGWEVTASKDAAQDAYLRGATSLDGDGDGVACEIFR